MHRAGGLAGWRAQVAEGGKIGAVNLGVSVDQEKRAGHAADGRAGWGKGERSSLKMCEEGPILCWKARKKLKIAVHLEKLDETELDHICDGILHAVPIVCGGSLRLT